MLLINRICLICLLTFSYQQSTLAMMPPKKRARILRNLYNPATLFKMSRTKLELFLTCPHCFYLDCKLGIRRPSGYPFTLNIAVDALLKKEFDLYRARKESHPLFTEANIHAIPFAHSDLEKWRDSLHHGLQFEVPETNIMLYGGIDDVWIDTDTKELIVVDYKATSKAGRVSIDEEWQADYRRQVEIYQWLLQKMLQDEGLTVSKTAYFVYCNAKSSHDRFDAHLDFEISILPYTGNSLWVGNAVVDAYKCLQADVPPEPCETCTYCSYFTHINSACKRHCCDIATQCPETEEPA